jgi:hypothetical protein
MKRLIYLVIACCIPAATVGASWLLTNGADEKPQPPSLLQIR